jgi:hypothetical protein
MQHQQWEILVPIINVELTQVEQKERSKKLVKVKRAWRESRYGAVIKHFRDNKDLEFVGNMVFALRRLETTIIEELLDLDGEVTDDGIRSCVLENVARWSEHLGIMARKLTVSGDRAWEEFDKIDSSNQEIDLS